MENTAITIFTITEFGNMRRFKRWSTIEVLLQSASMAATWLSVMTNRLMISSLVPWLMLRGLSTRERIFSRSSANRYEPVRIAKEKRLLHKPTGRYHSLESTTDAYKVCIEDYV